MDKTVLDLVRRTLQNIRVIAGTEEPNATDAKFVEETYRAAIQELEYIDSAAWDPESIPESVWLPMSDYLASRVAPSYGVEYGISMLDAERMLRRVTAKQYSGDPAYLNYM